MITYKKLLILKLSNITEWKSEAEMIIPEDMMEGWTGHLFTCEFLDAPGKHILRRYYGNGMKHWEYEWQNDQLHGRSTGWYKSGNKRWEYEYQNDQLHGKRIEYYENGQVEVEDEWRNDKCIREIK